MKRALVAATCLLVVAAPMAAQESADKSSYSLFRRVPRAQLRPLSTDRPDRTESPFTVDPGWFQIEADVVSYTDEGTSSRTGLALLNVKAGLTRNVDLQFLFETWLEDKSEQAGGTTELSSGTGSLTTRLKVNLFGNDDGRWAVALMPYVSLARDPGVDHKVVTGGLIVPVAFDPGGGWGLGAMLQLDGDRAPSESTSHLHVITSVTGGRGIIGPLRGYVELFSDVDTAEDAFVATANGGLTLGVTENLQLDVGVNVGLTDAADDVNPFLGIAARF